VQVVRGGFRGAFLSEGHGTAKRESDVGEPPNPPCNMYFGMGWFFFYYFCHLLVLLNPVSL